MNHYSARQRVMSGRWDFVSSNRRSGTYRVGYCSGPFDTCFPEVPTQSHLYAYLTVEYYHQERERYLKFADRFHGDGHETKAEAEQCYRRYILDTQLRRFNPSTRPTTPEQLHLCNYRDANGVRCGVYTAWYVEIGHTTLYHLCDTHRTDEIIESMYPASTEIWSSY